MASTLFAVVLVAACTGSDSSIESGFGSPEQAAQAFAPEDLPEVEPWDDREGACRVLLVGDSLVEATLRAQADAFTYVGCESIVDGLAARSLSEGWQCLADGGRSMAIVLKPFPEMGNPTCRPSGLELLGQWKELNRAASATVIALGTNDAGMFSEEGWIQRWSRVAQMTTGPLVFVTVAAQPGNRWVEKAQRYNETLRTWCPFEPRCHLAEWDLTDPAQDTTSYVDHVHLTRAAGEMRAVFIAVVTRRVAQPAPPGPSRWRAPDLVFPIAPSTTINGSFTTVPLGPAPNPPSMPSIPSNTTAVPAATTTSTIAPSMATTTTTTTTTANPAISPST